MDEAVFIKSLTDTCTHSVPALTTGLGGATSSLLGWAQAQPEDLQGEEKVEWKTKKLQAPISAPSSIGSYFKKNFPQTI